MAFPLIPILACIKIQDSPQFTWDRSPFWKQNVELFNLEKEETDLFVVVLPLKPKGSLSLELWISCACTSPDTGAQRGQGSSQGPIGGLCSYMVPYGKLLCLLKESAQRVCHWSQSLDTSLPAKCCWFNLVDSVLKTCCSFGWVKRWFISCPVGCQPALMVLSARAHSCPGWREWQLGQPWGWRLGLDGPLSFKASGGTKPSSWFGVTICV